MRNLKKILALVLALVMSMSLMATANAYGDDASIDADYSEAVAVLTGLGVFQGVEAADGTMNFNPTTTITREEVAAIIYRIVSGDVDDSNKNLYVDGADFTDVAATRWSAGYIGYCANGNYVQGYNGKFSPAAPVTGYQALAMILRAVGYDKNGEFTGADWQKNVATYAQQLGMLKNLDDSVVLSQPATREVVAEILFQAILATKVEYTPAFGYQPVVNNINVQKSTIAWDTFRMFSTVKDGADKWSNPNYKWVRDYNKNSVLDAADVANGVVATINYKAVAEYTVATKECDVASALKLKTTADYPAIVNGEAAETVTINAIDTVNTIGAQGRLTKVYNTTSKETGAAIKVITMVDTFLAKVTNVVPMTLDNAGHVKTPAYLYLTIYDGTVGGTVGGTAVIETKTTGNYTYTIGEYILVNAYTQNADADLPATGTILKNGNAAKYIVLGKTAEAFTGAQTIIWNNLDKHTVNGADYNDAVAFYLNQAGDEITNHTWMKDTYGNLIGVVDIDTQYTYGVLSALWWYNDGTNGGVGSAYGKITYMDGTESDIVKIASINGLPTTYAQSEAQVGAIDTAADDETTVPNVYAVSTYATNNAALLSRDMFQIATLPTGKLALTEMAELDEANVYNKISAITGTSTTVNNYAKNTAGVWQAVATVSETPVYADNFTQYLIGTEVAANSWTFTTATGIENIATYAADANIDVDYVDVDGDDFVDYVYITGKADAADVYEWVYVTSNTSSATLYDSKNGVYYYTLYGVIDADGSTEPLKFLTTDLDDLEELKAGVNKLFMVKTTNGYVEDVTEVGATGFDLVTTSTYTTYAEYEGGNATYTSADGVNGVLVVDDRHYNVNAVNTLVVDEDGVGSTADLTAANLMNKYVYVVSQYNGITDSRIDIATAIFITDYVPAVVNPDAGYTVKVISAGGNTYRYTDLATAVASTKKAGATITLLDDVTLNAQLELTVPVTLDGNGHTITAGDYKTATAATNGGILVSAGAAGTTIKNLTVVGPDTNIGWDSGEYGIKVYAAATLENVAVTGSNAGIQVAADTTLKGTINVSGNEFGGIEVKSNAVMTIATGAAIVNSTETAAVPTAWMDKEFDGTITGGALTSKIMSNEQVYYYVNSANAQ